MVKVSVIIPVYNTEKYIRASLDSIINQTLNEVEIIAVNDGSTDQTLEILREYADKYDAITVINQLNSGQSVARNKALQVASGKYVYFMDSDDLVSICMLEELFDKSEKEDLDVIYFSGKSFFENDELEEAHIAFKNYYLRKEKYLEVLSGPSMFVRLKDNKDYSMSPCLQMIKREHLLNNHITFQEGIIHEDNYFSFMVIMKAKRVYCVNDIYFYRRIREESVMTSALSHKNLRGYFVCFMKEMEFAAQLGIDDMDVQEKIVETLWRLNYHVQDIYLRIPVAEQEEFLQSCTPYEKYFFKSTILKHIEMKTKLNNTINNLKQENQALKKAPQNFVKSIIGRPWKLVKGAVRCCRMYGFSYTIKRVFEKVAIKFR